jgi:beta-lactamase class A
MADAGDVRSDPTPVALAMREVFARVGVQGWLHARALDGGGNGDGETGLDADEPVVLASVVKVLIVLEYARQSAAGQLPASERTRVRGADRLGGLGTAGCLDDVDISWRDLAWLAMSISDNTAAELLLRRVGVDTVRALAAELGLAATRVEGGPRHAIETLVDDVAGGDPDVFAERFPRLSAAQVRSLRACDPVEATASTPRDVTALLAAIWSDRAGPAAACAEVRSLMARQANWHRLAAGFPDEVAVAAKTGTLACVRNEAGVVTYPDGHRYAVAVFTAHDTPGRRRPDLDAAIGEAACIAVTALRP